MSKDPKPTHTTVDRCCGSCAYWGETVVFRNQLGDEIRECEYPVPIWQDKHWRGHAGAGHFCKTWKEASDDR